MKSVLLMAALTSLFVGRIPDAVAVEPSAVKIGERWSVVGIISGEGANAVGIAVLRNNVTKRTYTLSVGDNLPNEWGFTLKSVRDRRVVVADPKHDVTLNFAEPNVEDTEEISQTTRFIENYYRSLNERAVDAAGLTEGGLDMDAETPPEYRPIPSIPRYNPIRNSGGARIDLYRSDRSYSDRNYGAEAVDADGFVVDYDNDDGYQGEEARREYMQGYVDDYRSE